MIKPLTAVLLGLVSLQAAADHLTPPPASSLAPALTADDYLRCSSQYFLLSQMKDHPSNIDYGAAVGLAKALAVVTSSEEYVAKHQPKITDAELKKITDASDTGALPVYMDTFRYQLKQCAKAIDQAGNVYGPKLQAYAKRHQPAAAAPAASSGK